MTCSTSGGFPAPTGRRAEPEKPAATGGSPEPAGRAGSALQPTDGAVRCPDAGPCPNLRPPRTRGDGGAAPAHPPVCASLARGRRFRRRHHATRRLGRRRPVRRPQHGDTVRLPPGMDRAGRGRLRAPVSSRRRRRPRRGRPDPLPPPRADRGPTPAGLGTRPVHHTPRCQHLRATRRWPGTPRRSLRSAPTGHHGGGHSPGREPARPGRRPRRPSLRFEVNRYDPSAFFIASPYPLTHTPCLALRPPAHRPDHPELPSGPQPLWVLHTIAPLQVSFSQWKGQLPPSQRSSAREGPPASWSSGTSTPPGATGASGSSSMPA